MNGTWKAWSFRIADVAFKHVQPLSMEIQREKVIARETGLLWWKKTELRYTGRWCILLKYNRGPGTIGRTARIYFSRESDARFWFNQTYESVFLEQRQVMPPLPPKKTDKKRPSKPGLRLV